MILCACLYRNLYEKCRDKGKLLVMLFPLGKVYNRTLVFTEHKNKASWLPRDTITNMYTMYWTHLKKELYVIERRISFWRGSTGLLSYCLMIIKSLFWHQNPKTLRVILHRKGTTTIGITNRIGKEQQGGRPLWMDFDEQHKWRPLKK